jgi:hypothetical protein
VTIKKNTGVLINSSKEVGLEINTKKAEYKLRSRHLTSGQKHDIKIANRFFENAAELKNLGTTVTNQNLI